MWVSVRTLHPRLSHWCLLTYCLKQLKSVPGTACLNHKWIYIYINSKKILVSGMENLYALFHRQDNTYHGLWYISSIKQIPTYRMNIGEYPCGTGKSRKEGNVLFNDALNTFFILRLYGVRHIMVKDHSDSERGNPLPPHGLLFPISSKGSFICTIPQTG